VKILQLHNRYQQLGGEDAVLLAEFTLLSSYDQQVNLLEVTNDRIQSVWGRVSAAVRCVYSKSSKEDVRVDILRYKPDVVHVHNFFPLLTPSIYDACADAGVPVVQTLHNYRLICPGALLMRDGQVCENCITGSPYQAVLHGCYRDSRFGSLIVARMVDFHRKHHTWSTKVDRFIALTKFAKQKFVSAGFPSNRITVKPNFVVSNERIIDVLEQDKSYALFVGRLSAEKGIETLLRTWNSLSLPLHLVGDGPLLKKIQYRKPDSVTCHGHLSLEDVRAQMSHASFLVMPSEWYEGFPMVLVEAFSRGLPVIVSRLGGLAEIVENGITGLHFEAGNSDDLAEKVCWMQKNSDVRRKMGANARQVYLERYTPERNYKMLMQIYRETINNHV